MTTIGKLLLGVALGASLPTMAMAQFATNDPDRNGNQREDRAQNRGDGRGFGGGRGAEAQAARQAQQQQQQQQQQVQRPDQPQRPDRPQDFSRDRGQNGSFAGNQGRDDRRGYGNRFDDNRNDGRRFDNNRNDGRRFDNDRGRFDTNNRGGDNRWVGSNWRQDQRYNWQGYRNSNRNQFRGGRYNAPRGWSYGYRRFSVGAVLPGLLWGSGFWLNDPYQYRLPPAYGPYRWVRYYDDVMLVDTRTGRVIDAIPGFFW